MIDVVKEINAFKPIDITHPPEKYRPVTEQKKAAFILYNKALHEVQIGNDDYAKNYVKKALALFSDFYEAHMVHGILVFAKGDRNGALAAFTSVKDPELRSESVKLLNHLASEADRPEPPGRSRDKHLSYERVKADSVIGVSNSRILQDETKEARYSKGRVFEKSSGFYEPQTERSGAGSGYTRERHGAGEAASGRRQAQTGGSSYSSAHQRSRENYERAAGGERNPKTRAAGDVSDFMLLNKCLLIIVSILLVFSIIVSTILINKMASEKKLKDRLDELSKQSVSDTNTGADASGKANVD